MYNKSTYFKSQYFKSSYFGISELVIEIWRDTKIFTLDFCRGLGWNLNIETQENYSLELLEEE